MKRNRAPWISLLMVMALILTGCLGSSVEDKKDEAKIQAELTQLTEEFVEGFTSENLDSEEFLAFFADPMKFVIVFEGEELPDFATMIELSLEDEEFRKGFLEEAPIVFLDMFDELLALYEEHGIDSKEVQDAINDIVDTLAIPIKASIIAGFILGDPENITSSIMEWAEQSDLLAGGIEMPRDVLDAFIASDIWLFAGSTVENRTQPTKDDEEKWHVVLDITIAGEGLEDGLEYIEDPKPVTITLGFKQFGTKWLIDRFQMVADLF